MRMCPFGVQPRTIAPHGGTTGGRNDHTTTTTSNRVHDLRLLPPQPPLRPTRLAPTTRVREAQGFGPCRDSSIAAATSRPVPAPQHTYSGAGQSRATTMPGMASSWSAAMPMPNAASAARTARSRRAVTPPMGSTVRCDERRTELQLDALVRASCLRKARAKCATCEDIKWEHDNADAKCAHCLLERLNPTRYVRIASKVDQQEVTAYEVIYGIHPREFHFVGDGSKIPAAYRPIVLKTNWAHNKSAMPLPRQGLRRSAECDAPLGSCGSTCGRSGVAHDHDDCCP